MVLKIAKNVFGRCHSCSVTWHFFPYFLHFLILSAWSKIEDWYYRLINLHFCSVSKKLLLQICEPRVLWGKKLQLIVLLSCFGCFVVSNCLQNQNNSDKICEVIYKIQKEILDYCVKHRLHKFQQFLCTERDFFLQTSTNLLLV